jgi:hypothetical protein
MRHYWITCDGPDLPSSAFRKALGRNRAATLEGGKGGDAPAPPDPYATAGAQTQQNQQTAEFNKYLNLNDYSNPFGSQTTVQTGTAPDGAPIFSTQISANPQLQGQLDNLLGQTGQSGRINSTALSGLYGLAGSLSPQAAQQAQAQGQQAAYASTMGYLQPQFQQQQTSLQAQLANQGLAPGSEAYDNAYSNLQRAQGQQQQQAINNAVLTGSQVGSQNLQNQINSINTQGGLLGQTVGIGQAPYSNLQTIASMIPGYTGTAPSSANASDIASYMNNAYQGQLAGHNADVASSNQTTQEIGGMASMAAMAIMMY